VCDRGRHRARLSRRCDRRNCLSTGRTIL
jgi:hypothetical protein